MSGYRQLLGQMMISSGIIAVAGIAALVALVIWPIDASVSESAGDRVLGRASIARASEPSMPEIAISDLPRKTLQKSLEPPPPPRPQAAPTPVVAAQPPLPDITLIATAKDTDEQFSMVWLQAPNKSPILVRIGSVVDLLPGSPKLTEIGDGQATLMFGSREMKLELKKKSIGY